METPRIGREEILKMAASFEGSCVLAAAAELDVFPALAGGEATAVELAGRLESDLRGLTMLLDAVVALRLLEKHDDRYRVPDDLRPFLTSGSSESVLPMILHRANVARGWTMLAWTVKAGYPAPGRRASGGRGRHRRVRGRDAHGVGPDGRRRHCPARSPAVHAPDRRGRRLGHLDPRSPAGTARKQGHHLRPSPRDLPGPRPHRRDPAGRSRLVRRWRLLPRRASSRRRPCLGQRDRPPALPATQPRLFAKVHRALVPGGTIAIRDVVMAPDRTSPLAGALFAINMLANTVRGTTFTFAELADDLQASGFVDPRLPVEDVAMNSIVVARKP